VSVHDLVIWIIALVGVSALWDLVRPHDLKLDYNNAGRLILSVLGQVSMISLLLLLLGAAPAIYALVFVSIVAVASVKALIDS
jgi:hypothetical protein